ncbi:MAG: enoyl-CoA hydratase/isomerase family protein [Solirubrobacterales bacterium]|nr:enoyl-CoA hydratase/isomerase family protein [Solirubrobacterales bacterium]MBV9535726.1 enoyl-CoA hydratase/isomerase family protein [Solirubrobacterales bacterium]
MPELLELRREQRTCIVTLRREHKLNAISSELERELCAALDRNELREAACVVLTGGARAFSAGADLNEMRGLDPAAIVSYYEGTGDFAERVAGLPQPTFSAISGYCLGGGLELALATDFRIADEHAVFGLPEVGLGILPSSGGTHRLVQMLGPARAKELILLRDRVSAPEAHHMGLVTEVVGEGEALSRALIHAERLAALPQLAARVTKRVIDSMSEGARSAGLELERLAYGLLAQTPDAEEATERRLSK